MKYLRILLFFLYINFSIGIGMLSIVITILCIIFTALSRYSEASYEALLFFSLTRTSRCPYHKEMDMKISFSHLHTSTDTPANLSPAIQRGARSHKVPYVLLNLYNKNRLYGSPSHRMTPDRYRNRTYPPQALHLHLAIVPALSSEDYSALQTIFKFDFCLIQTSHSIHPYHLYLREICVISAGGFNSKY